MPQARLELLLKTLKTQLQQTFGDQFAAMLLFGSQARNEAWAGSDVDVLVLLRDDFDYGAVRNRTSETIADLSLENDVVISTVFVPLNRYQQQNSPFFLNVRREGRLI
jgi:uncharacterized protein